MDEPKINPSSPDDGRSDGPPSQSPIPNYSGPKGAEVEESTSAAPNSAAFMSNSLESGSPMDGKMEKVSLMGRSDDLLPGPDAPAAAGEGRREESEDGDTGSDDGSSETATDDSESDESSSEESDTSTSTGSDEEEEEEEDDDSADGNGGEDPEEVPVGSDDEEVVVRGPIKSKNELEVLPPVPQVEVSLKPHHQTFPVGVISSVLGNRVIVEGSENHKPLNEGSILWITETRSPLGIVDEIFGPVKNPYYVVRYNSVKDVPVGINEGTAVSFVIEFANYVLYKDLHKKGYDASGENDEEISDEVEFSDDEQEVEYKKSLRQAKRGTDDRKFGNQENDTRKKKTNFKGAGSQKGMVPPVPHGFDPSVRGPCRAPSRAWNSDSGKSLSSSRSAHACENSSPLIPTGPRPINLLGDLANPAYQLSQHPNTTLGHGVSHLQQPNAFSAYGMPMPMPLQQQQQQQLLQNAVWPLAFPTQQQQLNAILPHGTSLQKQQIAAMTGFQMNCLPNQQLGNGAYLHQHQNQGFSNNQNTMLSPQQILQMLGIPNMPWIGGPLNSSAGLMPPLLGGQAGIGQASLVPTEQGVSGLGNHQSHGQSLPAPIQGGMDPPLQFNPGSSSVRGRMPHQRGGGHSFRRGM